MVAWLPMQVLTLYSSKTKVSETYFFDIVATHNEHPSYVKHVLHSIYVFFTLFWYLVWTGGVPQLTGTQPAHAVFHPVQLKNRTFRTLLFLILWPITVIIKPM